MKRRFLVEIDTRRQSIGGEDGLTPFIQELVADGLLLEGGVTVAEIEPYEISMYDRERVGDVLATGDWFSADLLRLIAKSDPAHKARIRLGFPELVDLYEAWLRGDHR